MGWQTALVSHTLPTPVPANVSAIEASPFDAGTAYVAIESLRLGDHRPHLFRTRDFGASWTEINEGLPVDEVSGSVTRVIRADPKRRGLLFVGTESGVRVSFDDGDHWQSLKLNMPDTPCWDLTFKDNDLIVGTYGRGICPLGPALGVVAALLLIARVDMKNAASSSAQSGGCRRSCTGRSSPLPREYL